MHPENVPIEDDATTPILVSGILGGLAGGIAGSLVTGVAALVHGDGFFHPARLVAASLMGREALDRDNALPAMLLGTLLALVAAAALGGLFAWVRRRELRTRVLALEGIAFALAIFGLVHVALPWIDPTMAAGQARIPLGVGFALFGACLSLEAPLRTGAIRPDEAIRTSLSFPGR